jgi:hypothetical protein
MIVGRNDTGAELHGNRLFESTLMGAISDIGMKFPHIVGTKIVLYVALYVGDIGK